MTPAPDLRRLVIPQLGITVAKHGSDEVAIASEDWLVNVQAITSAASSGLLSGFGGIARRGPACRLDTRRSPAGATVHRLVRRGRGVSAVRQADYLIGFGDAWVMVWARSRDFEEFDLTPIDAIVDGLRMLDRPEPAAVVPPAWRAYQARRQAGSPVAKFTLAMAPAPVLLGSAKAEARADANFTDEEYRRGGRQLGPDLIEFYTRGDPSSIRVDVWLGDRPDAGVCEPILAGTLRVESGRVHLWSSGPPEQDVAIPPGDYDVAISRVNADRESDRMLTEEECFGRDDLERYEIHLKPR